MAFPSAISINILMRQSLDGNLASVF